MNIKNILITAAWASSFNCLQAQEYINIEGIENSFYFLVEDVDSITISEPSSLLSKQLANDPYATIYSQALKATRVDSIINDSVYDFKYDKDVYSKFYYTSGFRREVATVPDTKKTSYTLFVTPDDVLAKHGINNLEDLYLKACELYDPIYPNDVAKPWHAYDQLTDERNPLNRYMRYTILKCDIGQLDRLTGLILNQGVVQGTLGVKTNLVNPTDWYQTLLPNTLMKCEQLTVSEFIGKGTKYEYYINRRYDKEIQMEGVAISRTLPENMSETPNGRYFYVNDIVAFTKDVRDVVQNTRIRMDFSTVFPELTSQYIRLNGDPTKDDNSSVADESYKYGRNYYFPDGYLDGVKCQNGTTLIYRRSHWNFWCWQGDELNIFGDYDFSFRLPPIPFTGEWQIRLGFCALATRGEAVIYVNEEYVSDTIDFRLRLDDESVLGKVSYDYLNLAEEEKAKEHAFLKAKGYYRAPYSAYHTDGNVINDFVTNPQTYRRVVYQGALESNKENYMRIRCTSSNKLGNNHEFMLDYIELVPKTVYDGAEDNL